MSVILHGNHYSIVFLNSWDVSGAMENVWNEDLILTIPLSSAAHMSAYVSYMCAAEDKYVTYEDKMRVAQCVWR